MYKGPYYQKAANLGSSIEGNNGNVKVDVYNVNREEWPQTLQECTAELGGKAVYHKTCPLVVEGCNEDTLK
eukprot:gene15935-18944_t